jgi:hypothetical protein
VGPMPAPSRWPFNVALALGVCVTWWVRYGPMGPYYDTDAALAGAMALRPWGGEFIYQWGGTHIGSIIPLLSVPFVKLGVDAHVASQLALLLTAGGGIALLLGQFRRWPFAICFALVLAFPSAGIADTTAQTWCHVPGALLFLGAELVCLREAAARPKPWLCGLTGLFAGLTLWAADNAFVFYATQVPLVLAALWRQRLTPGLVGRCAGAALGLGVAAALILAGKHAGMIKPHYYDLNGISGALKGWRGMVPAGGSLIPLVPSFGLMRGLLGALMVGSMVLAWRGLQRPLAETEPLSLLGAGPFLGLVATCFSSWYTDSCSPRYIGLPLVMGELGLCLVGDWAQQRLEVRWPGHLRRVTYAFGALAAVIALANAWVDCGNDRDLLHWPIAIGDGYGESGPHRGVRWREKVAAAERQGCDAVVAAYWESYPYFELSQGRVLATDRENDIAVRSRSLADDSVHSANVCVVPWWGRGTCPATLRQFGAVLTEPELVTDLAEQQRMTFCRYRGAPR